jgi:RNA polymerase sigma-70 factor (ECF subfamily)
MSDNTRNTDQEAVDTEWTAGIAVGNAASFEKLFNHYCQPLINFSRRYVRDRQAAENIVQDIFVRIWTNHTNLDPSKSIKSYLFTSVKNESLKYLRHLDVELKSIGKMADPANEGDHPEKNYDQSELERNINKAVSELPAKCREIFSMSRFDNLKYAEIAQILNISVKTVETQMGRALKKLRERLKPFLILLITAASALYFAL